MVLSACHFLLYAPSPLVWITRSALGFLMSTDLYNLLAGLYILCSVALLSFTVSVIQFNPIPLVERY